MHAFREGDIVACYGACAVSRIIRWATASPFAPSGLRLGPSHVALIVEHQGRARWAEATTLTRRRCIVSGRITSGWQMHEIEDRLEDFTHVAVYRLHPFYRLDWHETEEFHTAAVNYWIEHPTPYDAGGAMFSGSRFAALTSLYPPADLASVFCSEYIAAVLRRLGRLPADANPARYNPARLLRHLLYAGTYLRVRSISPGIPRITP